MPIPQSLPPLKRVLLRDDVYETLLALIVDQELSPDEILADKDLALRLGVSRTPVRESIRRLEEEGFVITAAHQWTQVAPVDLKQAEDLYPIIRELESLAMSSCIDTIDAKQLSSMERSNEELKRALQQGDTRAAVRLDSEFHALVHSAGGNLEIQSILRLLKFKIRRIERFFFEQQTMSEASVAEHAALVDALRERNEELARTCLRVNWNQSLARLKIAVLAKAKTDDE